MKAVQRNANVCRTLNQLQDEYDKKNNKVFYPFLMATAQCPQSGLKIQTTACDSPRNIQVKTIDCRNLRIQWQGNQDQNYILNITSKDVVTGKTQTANSTAYSCDGSGHCIATINVDPGAAVSWNLQSLCSTGGTAVYGYPIVGGPVIMPACFVQNSADNRMHIYPNPTTGKLTVDYPGDWPSPGSFSILDMTGKKVLSIPAGMATQAGSTYVLDLPRLTSGTYLLKVNNGKERRGSLFVLIK
jgi:hypothetical protein